MRFSLAVLITFFSFSVTAQHIEKALKPFSKIIISPRVNLILQKGNEEKISLEYANVSQHNINIEVRGKTLHIYLDKARKTEKTKRTKNSEGKRHGVYEGAAITAYVTYKEIEYLEMRGNQVLTCYDPIEAEQFKLKAYGENNITLASLKTEYFKASLYGENDVRIKNGKAMDQRYRVYGENKINTQEMKSTYTSTSMFGDGELRINTTEEVRVNAFGDSHIHIDGGAHISNRLVLGKAKIYTQ
jgi:HSP20 family molecular chaperone IbpA